ncbi:LytR C-terminal domain-containing protein [Corynebacterium imitans]|uniref:LytR C-terminal domain-containing protein n=1 Tax=Corynebacterium imitans TaxID=156978 RepID=UPI001EF29DE1|nr:LytR C-terminal domain-containing protein [Corynebacterium imitans]
MNTVNPGDGHRGRDEFPRESDEYRGAHRRADEPDEAYEDYEGYEDYADEPEYVEAEPVEEAGAGYVSADEAREGSTAVAAGAGAAAAAPAAARLPKRGLAMILLAVGLLLLLWGIFALGQNKDSSENAAQETQASQSADKGAADANAPGANNDANANDQTANGADNNAADKPAANNDAADRENNPDAANPDADRENNADNPDANNPDNPAQPNPAAPDLTAQNAQVYVYNNSGVPDLANQTAGKLEGQYGVANKSQDAAAMNMPEQTFGVFPETFVFYNPQVAGAEQVAADIAQRVGGTPRATNDLPGNDTQLPSEALQNRHAITVVLAG